MHFNAILRVYLFHCCKCSVVNSQVTDIPTTHFYTILYMYMNKQKVTISTVGYGDFVASYGGSRVVICLLLIAIVLVLPGQINELSRMMSQTSKYRKRFEPSVEQSHVIVTAKRITKEKIEAFFREFYCASRAATTGHRYYTIIVSSDEPSGL